MRILFLSEQFYPHGGGAELATYLYAKLLCSSSIDVKVITNRFSGEDRKFRSGELEIFRLPLFKDTSALKYSMLGNLDVLFSSFLRRMIRWADVVYVPLFWYSAIPLTRAYGKPVVTHLHNYISACPLGTLYDHSKNRVCHNHHQFLCSPSCIIAHEKTSGRKSSEIVISALLNSVSGTCIAKLAALSDSLVCVSEAQRRVIAQSCGKLFRDKLQVIYNPLPNIPYMNGGGESFGYFGGPSYTKGFHVLYRAVKTMNQYGFKAVKIHATKFQNVSKTKMAMLNKMGFVLHGKLGNPKYEKVYSEIRSVVFPSIWEEPLPYVLIEALLRGRIVIASKIGGVPEITEGCDGAFLFHAGNHEQLVEKIQYVRDLNTEDIIELGTKNRQKIKKKFSNKRTIQKFINLLNEVAQDRSFNRTPIHKLNN